LAESTADIASAYVSKSSVKTADLPALIQRVHRALSEVAFRCPGGSSRPAARGAVPVRKSITPDYLVWLEDGRRFKSLTRHVRTKYDMRPGQYRSKRALPKNYPMVAPNHAAVRSALAKEMALGQRGGRAAVAPVKLAGRGRAKAGAQHGQLRRRNP
jgi:predicted transcriptional regulator